MIEESKKQEIFKDTLVFISDVIKKNNEDVWASEKELTDLQEIITSTVKEVLSSPNSITKNREVLKEIISNFTALSVVFMEKQKTPYRQLNDLLSWNLQSLSSDFKKYVSGLDELLVQVKEEVGDDEQSVNEVMKLILNKEILKRFIQIQVFDFLKILLGDVVLNKDGEIDQTKNWVDYVVFSFSIYWESYYRKKLGLPLLIKGEAHKVAKQFELYAGWYNLLDEQEIDLVSVWQGMWMNEFGTRTVFEN